jgi:putative endonuclease
MGRNYYIYIMTNRTHMLYVGVTNNLYRRVDEHRRGATAGFTSKYNMNRLVYFEHFEYIGDAIAREKEIKGWVRRKKIALIEAENPKWSDLSLGLFSDYER